MIHFKTWLLQFKKDENRFGDLARDIQIDESFPKENDYSEILNHLRMVDACDNAVDTFKDAWNNYQSNNTQSLSNN